MIQEFTTWFITHPLEAFILLFIEYVILFELWYRLKGTIFEKIYKLIFGYLIFVPQDWLMNIMLSVIFLDAPGSLNELVTGRMKRYKKTYSFANYSSYNLIEKWRVNFAYYLCEHLNPYDARHC